MKLFVAFMLLAHAFAYRNIVGFHLGPGGDQDNVLTYLQQLDSAKVPFSIKNVDEMGLLDNALQLKNASGVPHSIIWRSTNTDVPPYSLDPESAANQHWAKVKSNFPPELEQWKGHLWLEVINEPDQTKCGWLSNFSIAISNLAVGEGWDILSYGWSTGTPYVGAQQPSCWESPEAQAFLRLVETNNAKGGPRMGVALHEYSNSLNITNEWPWLLGRVHFLVDSCNKHGITPPPILITEWGYTGCDVKLPPPDGIADLDYVMRGIDQYAYSTFPTLEAAMLWYLGPWSCPISEKADQMVLPITNYTISSYTGPN